MARDPSSKRPSTYTGGRGSTRPTETKPRAPRFSREPSLYIPFEAQYGDGVNYPRMDHPPSTSPIRRRGRRVGDAEPAFGPSGDRSPVLASYGTEPSSAVTGYANQPAAQLVVFFRRGLV